MIEAKLSLGQSAQMLQTQALQHLDDTLVVRVIVRWVCRGNKWHLSFYVMAKTHILSSCIHLDPV